MSSLPRRWARRAPVWAAGWLLAAALYLLLIDTTSLPELIVGAGVATISAIGFELAREQYVAAETVRLRWFTRALRPVIQAPSDIVTVCRVALAQLLSPRGARGEFRAVPFRCDEVQARQTGRWALAESLGSFAPNTIVIGVDPERELLLGHQLQRKGGREAIDMLELG